MSENRRSKKPDVLSADFLSAKLLDALEQAQRQAPSAIPMEHATSTAVPTEMMIPQLNSRWSKGYRGRVTATLDQRAASELRPGEVRGHEVAVDEFADFNAQLAEEQRKMKELLANVAAEENNPLRTTGFEIDDAPLAPAPAPAPVNTNNLWEEKPADSDHEEGDIAIRRGRPAVPPAITPADKRRARATKAQPPARPRPRITTPAVTTTSTTKPNAALVEAEEAASHALAAAAEAALGGAKPLWGEVDDGCTHGLLEVPVPETGKNGGMTLWS